jgi:integrase
MPGFFRAAAHGGRCSALIGLAPYVTPEASRRVKNGTPSTHPLLGDELRALRRLQRDSVPSPFVFVSERGSPFTTAGFARMIERAAVAAGLKLKAHPHMLRHACGYALAKSPSQNFIKDCRAFAA